MDARNLILEVVKSNPGRRVEGKKRLQKICHLLKRAGADIEVDFRIHHYGPYSREIADAADFMVVIGAINEEEEPLGIFGTYQTVYSLPDGPNVAAESKLLPAQQKLLNQFDIYHTVELEVASTIAYFESQSMTREQAETATCTMKPTKSVPDVLKKAEEILDLIAK